MKYYSIIMYTFIIIFICNKIHQSTKKYPRSGYSKVSVADRFLKMSDIPLNTDVSKAKPSPPIPIKAIGFKKTKLKRKVHHKSNSPTEEGQNSEFINTSAVAAFRLQPDEVIPSHYTMCIKPDFEEFTYEGCVSIALKIKKETKYILMNAIDLNITKIIWEEDITENKQEPLEFFIDIDNQILKIYFEPSILPSTGCIRINFNSMINTKLTGLYRSKYINSKTGEDAYHILTRFEPIYARSCFPCWDEPSFKCTFDLSLILPKDSTAISNMPVKISYPHRNKPHLKIVEFDKTPLMSTFLFCFAIGEFSYLEYIPRASSITSESSPPHAPGSSSGQQRNSRASHGRTSSFGIQAKATPCRIYTVPGKEHEGEFALAICVKLLSFYKKYFEMSFPLPKLDLYAVTEFVSGGVENWGLITMKESRVLLTHENAKPFNTARKVAICIAHLLAHQWIGNLVTMEWWTHLWLSNGFATYLEYVALDHLFPDFNIWTVFYTEIVLEVLKYDGLKNSHPVEVPVSHPNEIKDIFDHISYNKGAALLLMLHEYIGEAMFKKSITNYLNKFQYKNIATNNLWKIFEIVSGKPVGTIMTSWTRKQMGYPLIRIISTKYEENSRTLTLAQEKFWYDLSLRDSRIANKDYLWIIPLTFAIGSNPTQVIKEVVMDKRMLNVTIPNIQKSQWIKINPGGIGYYRVKYLPEMVIQFHQCIRNRTMPPLDRIGILNDMYAFSQSGVNSVLELFSLLEAFGDEDNYTVWTEINTVLESLDHLLSDMEYYGRFHVFCRMSLNNILERVGWGSTDKEEGQTVMKLRALILSRLVLAGHDETLVTAEQKFRQHISGDEIVPVELRSVVYQGALIKGTPTDTLRFLLKRYKETDSHEEHECIIHSLNALTSPDLIHDVLEFAISEHVHANETLQMIKIVARSHAGRDLAWQFFKTHQNQFRGMYSPSVSFTHLVEAVAENFTSEVKASEILEYFRDKYSTHPGLERTVLQIVEKIRINEAWLKRESAMIEDFLSTYYE